MVKQLKLKDMMTIKNKTTKDVALSAQTTESEIRSILSGRHGARADTLYRIAKALGCTMDDIYTPEEIYPLDEM